MTEEAGNAVSAAGLVQQDLPCRICGYNLRGLRSDGRCPECRAAVGRSLQGDFLRFCDPAWVERIALGAKMMAWALPATGCALAAVGAMRWLLGLAAPIWSAPLMMVITFLTGLWLASSPEPAERDVEKSASARRVVRIWLMAVIAIAFLPLVSKSMGFPKPNVIAWLIGFAIAGGLAVVPSYARRIVKRIPDDALALETTVVTIALMLSLGFSVLLGWAAMMPGSLPPAVGMVFAIWPTMLVGTALFGLWSLRLAGRYRAGLTQAAKEARATWAAEAQ